MESKESLQENQQALAFHRGEEEALLYIFNHFHPVLSLFSFRWVKNKFIAEEIASDAIMKTWKMHWKLDSFPAIRAYLYKTVVRDSQLAYKREKRRAQVHWQSQPDEILNETPFHSMVRLEVYRQIHAAIKDLTPANQKVITMHFIEGKSTGEIAQELKLSSSTIRNQKMGALIALRKKLGGPILRLLSLTANFFFPLS